MRRSSSVTSVSWIPSAAIPGPMKIPFSLGVGHYDAPPPAELGDLTAWRDADRFRFANRLAAWIEVDDHGQITAHGHAGGGLIGSTTLRLGPSTATFTAISYPDLQNEPEVGDGWARFRQTVGGRTGAPMPRTVSRPPFVQLSAPTVWTTLELTLHADGRAEWEMTGASPFPRHWVYDDSGALVAKSGLTDFSGWSRKCFGDHSPWGDVDSPAVVTVAETALERTLSETIMRGGAKPRVRTLAKGEDLVRQGDPGRELFLLLDGVLEVLVDGVPVAELGPGAVGGERALLEGGNRTSTLRAHTRVRVAVATAEQVDTAALHELAEGHRREEQAGPQPTT
ncbi:MAG: cyclic nucleotide-binding domain-containing protein [Geodermatophilaceae bacterium]|nr:cyclic nucleotide-binding domain-containing protein [Geodermatophilaceae bacterium]